MSWTGEFWNWLEDCQRMQISEYNELSEREKIVLINRWKQWRSDRLRGVIG